MSDTLIEEVSEQITFDDLDVFWSENGLPIFLANRDNICDIVEQMGFSIYYLLGNLTKVTSNNSTNPTTKVVTTNTVSTSTMQLFKVVNNIVGRTVTSVNDPFNNDFVSIKESAIYNMPPIPHVLVDKLDQFFRLVDAQHGTESIVMLTYDTTKEGSEGWGILVPDQSNTAVHCNYDPDSIAQIKPDHVMIVGSVHSHPGMSAYASGTDHKDQADFDGLHITYGWQKSVNNGATQYHIEMQMAGKAYSLKPEDVFEDTLFNKSPDQEVVEWTEKVKKALPPSMGGAHTQHKYQAPLQAGAGTTHTAHGATKSKSWPSSESRELGFDSIRKQFKGSNLEGLEDNAIIVAEIDFPKSPTESIVCPSCAKDLDDFNFFNGYCDFCYIPIVEKDSSFEKIFNNLEAYCADLYMDTNVPVYLWTIDEDNTQSLVKICEGTFNSIQVVSDDEKEYIDTYTLDELIDSDTSFCCGEQLVNGIARCNCKTPIVKDDILDFDFVSKNTQLYETGTTKCMNCEYYYDINCPEWKSVLVKFVEDPKIDINQFAGTLNDSTCNSYEPYRASSNSVYSSWEE